MSQPAKERPSRWNPPGREAPVKVRAPDKPGTGKGVTGEDKTRKIKVGVVAMAFVLFLAIFPFWLSAMMEERGVDGGETFVIDRFTDNSTRVLVNSTFLGSDVSFKIPGDAEIRTAKLTLSGSLPPQRISYPVGRNPTDLDVGDVDGDLFTDVVVANYKDDTVMVMRNTGSTLVRDHVASVGKGPVRVLLRELDDDGYPDLLVLSEDAREFRVLLNDQIGGFRSIGDPYRFDSLPADLAVIDFDGDGDLDAAVVTTNNDNLTLFENDGNGGLIFHSNFTTQGNPTRIGVTDYDLDGKDDLIISNRRDVVDMNGGKHEVFNIEKERYYQWLSTVSFWSNAGQGNFVRKIDDLRVEKGVSSIDCGDVNGDTYPDIVMANLGYHDISIMESDGSGGFHKGSPSDMDSVMLGSMDPIQARLKDMDLDGDLDIIAATKSADSILVYVGNGKGDFQPYVQNYVGLNPTAFQFLDHDSDGDLDIVTSDWKGWPEKYGENGTVSILTNLRSGIFRTYSQYVTGNSPRGVFARDVDGDGDAEISTANYFGSTVSILRNDGLGGFSAPREYPIGLEPYAVVMEDFNNDGNMDGASADEANFRIVLLRSDGEGGFTTDRYLYDIGAYPFSLRTGDIDGDGDMDLYTSNYFQSSTTILFNDGSGDFANMFNNYTTVYLGSNMPYDSIIEDLDGDGIKDLLTVNRGDTLDPTDTMSVMINDGFYSFDEMVNYSVGKEPTSAVAFDIDGDGDLDIATTDTGDDTVTVMLNDGKGAFTKAASYTVGDRPQYINVMDIDKDGLMDYLVTNTDSNNLVFLKNLGNARFQKVGDMNIASYPFAIDTADFNKDGRMDIVLSAVNTNSVVVLGCYWYPSDVKIDVGADGTIDHEFKGLVTNEDSYEVDLTDQVRDYLKDHKGTGEVRVPIRVITGEEGIVVLRELLVVYS